LPSQCNVKSDDRNKKIKMSELILYL